MPRFAPPVVAATTTRRGRKRAHNETLDEDDNAFAEHDLHDHDQGGSDGGVAYNVCRLLKICRLITNAT
jgi:hypothetical protein